MNKNKIAVIILSACLITIGIYFVGLNESGEEIPPPDFKEPTSATPEVIPVTVSAPASVNLPAISTESFATSTQVATSTPIKEDIITATSTLLKVPFTAQAPFGNWADSRQGMGCEEASVLMAVRWAKGMELTLAEAEKEIIAISDFELAKYGYFEDTSIKDTALRILSGYFGYENYEVRYGISAADIIAELNKGNAVITALAGQKLGNPFYTPPGPVSHMMIVIGYDAVTKEFITNDPGTRHGEKFRYAENIFEEALLDYPSGNHEPITEDVSAMIVVRKS